MTKFDQVKLDTQVFQNGIPPAYLSPGVREPQLMGAGPDGVQRPLRVRCTFARCTECHALILPGDEGSHAAWHARTSSPTDESTTPEGDAP